jgi:hypothetical protein
MSPPGPVTGRSHRWPAGGWLLNSPLPWEAELDDHLRALLDQLDAIASVVQGYKGDEHISEVKVLYGPGSRDR